MQVKVNGKLIEVGVSDGGMFYDAATKAISAKTLDGLKKKLLDIDTPKGSVLVESADGSKRGTAINRNSSSRNYNVTYRVQWEDGTQTSEGTWQLRRPMTVEERQHKEQLEAANEVARVIYEQTLTASRNFNEGFYISEELKAVFH